jgi:hypothetical protein
LGELFGPLPGAQPSSLALKKKNKKNLQPPCTGVGYRVLPVAHLEIPLG